MLLEYYTIEFIFAIYPSLFVKIIEIKKLSITKGPILINKDFFQEIRPMRTLGIAPKHLNYWIIIHLSEGS